ncbi:BPSL0067 family protein [Jiella sonneratiae]|uniref:CHAP domain-containing protein n=1 Tax=Jiella sonneratiae TaxID=2816856 RepID=A0ABS3IXW9_9HYPH|nr:BPSL0067 family protein [Jiella sonneratiae]MBO0902236.1 CHAP domain-containing protein [Jiella sonneratiae]
MATETYSLAGVTAYAVDLTAAEKHDGTFIGSGKYLGQCAAGVEQVFMEAGLPIGVIANWRPGAQVKNNAAVKAGTAIASFDNAGKFHHAAIFVEAQRDGLRVFDQYYLPKKPWGKRTLFFKKGNNDPSNDGDMFYTIRIVKG